MRRCRDTRGWEALLIELMTNYGVVDRGVPRDSTITSRARLVEMEVVSEGTLRLRSKETAIGRVEPCRNAPI